MEMTSPDCGHQYLLPSARHIVVERMLNNDAIACRYVNADGTHSGIHTTKALVTFTLSFLLNYAKRIR